MRIKKIYNENLRETLYKGIHKSGLEVFILPKKDFRKKHAYFLTKYGSIYNTFKTIEGKLIEKPEGIAHFLEHKTFEEDEGNIFEKFALLGANVNAYTKFDSTTYNFSTVDNFYKALDLLISFVQKPYITDENVEKEKGIIEQEINMYLDNPDWKVYFNALRALYNDNPIKKDIAGTVESINEITAEDLNFCYKEFYSPKNMMLFIIGDIDKDKVCDQIEKSLSKEFINRDYEPKIVIPKEEEKVNKKRIVEEMDVSQPKFIVAFKDVKTYSNDELFKRALAIKIALNLIFGPSSKFYKNLYEEGIIDESFSTEHSFSQYYIHTIIGGETDNPEKLYKRILEEIKRVKNDGLVENDFIRIKRKFIGRYIASFNSLQSIASLFTSYYVKGISSFDYFDILENIPFDYVMKVFKEHLNEENSIISIVNKKEVDNG